MARKIPKDKTPGELFKEYMLHPEIMDKEDEEELKVLKKKEKEEKQQKQEVKHTCHLGQQSGVISEKLARETDITDPKIRAKAEEICQKINDAITVILSESSDELHFEKAVITLERDPNAHSRWYLGISILGEK